MSASAMFAELLATDGVIEHCELASPRIGFAALHGGLEATTFEIAAAAAERSGASLYAVVQPPGLRWHVPSTRFDPCVSERLAQFCDHVDVIVSLHGYGGVQDSDHRWTTALLGGSNRTLAQELGARLRSALPHYCFVDEIDAIPPAYRGTRAANPVNRCRLGGIQIELPPRIRGNSPVWTGTARDENGFVPHTAKLVELLAEFAKACSQR